MRFVPSAPVAVVIPVHDSVDDLRRTLACLREQEHDAALVVVVDDGSTDGTAAFLNATADVTPVWGDGSLWWSGAVDHGCREAIRRGSHVLLLWNDDNASAAPDCVRELVRQVWAKSACASPVVLEAPASAPPLAESMPRRILHAGGMTDWRAGVLRLHGHGATYVPSAVVAECDWLPGTALAFPSAVFKQLGGFDSRRFPQYRGDADFTLRARAARVSCLVVHSTWVVNVSTRTGLAFDHRVSVGDAVRGLVSLRSNYHLPSTVRFFVRHCPRRYLPVALPLFYAKYVYATLKSWRRPR